MLTRLHITQVNWTRGETGWSGLHYAAWCNYPHLTDTLLSQPGVDLNIEAEIQISPYYIQGVPKKTGISV